MSNYSLASSSWVGIVSSLGCWGNGGFSKLALFFLLLKISLFQARASEGPPVGEPDERIRDGCLRRVGRLTYRRDPALLHQDPEGGGAQEGVRWSGERERQPVAQTEEEIQDASPCGGRPARRDVL